MMVDLLISTLLQICRVVPFQCLFWPLLRGLVEMDKLATKSGMHDPVTETVCSYIYIDTTFINLF